MTTKATHISRFFSTEDVANGTISVAKLSNIYTSNVIEHVNLYFTTQRARDSFSAGTGVSILDGNISIGQPVYTNNSVSFNNLTLTGELRGPSTLVLDPAAIGDDTGTVQIRGNLQVDGTTTTINSTTLTVDDLNIVLAQGAANAAAASGAGISIDGANATLTYTSASDSWSFNKNLGIGTTSPAGPLEVIGTSGILITRSSKTASTSSSARILGGAFTGNTATAIFLDGVGGENRLNIGGGTGTGEPATSIKFYTGTAGATSAGTERMAIDASGNVSILTGAVTINGASIATADSMLNTQVTSAGSFLTLAEFRNLDYTAGTRSFIRIRNQVTAGGSYSSYFGQGQDGKTYIIANNSARGGDLVIDGNNGYLGIGTSSPNQRLDVRGYVVSDVNGNAVEGGFYVGNSGHGIRRAAGTNDVYLYTNGGTLYLGANGSSTNQVTVLTGGSVGIGTNNPSAKLTVSIGTATSGTVARFSAPSYDDVYIAAGQSSASCGIGTLSTSQFNIFVNSTSKIAIDNSGHVTPAANGTQNLGSTSLRWSTVYTSDLSLNNGIGDWTIVEGEDDLFIYNNRSNKVYKFKLEEVDPALATPKRG